MQLVFLGWGWKLVSRFAVDDALRVQTCRQAPNINARPTRLELYLHWCLLVKCPSAALDSGASSLSLFHLSPSTIDSVFSTSIRPPNCEFLANDLHRWTPRHSSLASSSTLGNLGTCTLSWGFQPTNTHETRLIRIVQTRDVCASNGFACSHSLLDGRALSPVHGAVSSGWRLS